VVRQAAQCVDPHGHDQLAGADSARARPAGKGSEHSILLGVHLMSVGFLDGRTEQTVVSGENLRVLVTQLLQKACGALDVSEEEGDRRKLPGSTPGNFSNVGARGARRA